MTSSDSTLIPKRNTTSIKTILIAWLVAGTMDISAASISVLFSGGDPLRMFKAIASGIFGAEALEGSAAMAVFGLFAHYCIAFIWAVFFYKAFPLFCRFTTNWVVLGVGYALVVWIIMNLVVLPLSNVPKFSPTLKGSIIGASILIICIGLPISYVVHKHYNKKQ